MQEAITVTTISAIAREHGIPRHRVEEAVARGRLRVFRPGYPGWKGDTLLELSGVAEWVEADRVAQAAREKLAALTG